MSAPLSLFRESRPLVLGATGFIGRWVVRALREHGAHVVGVSRSQEGAERLAREQPGTMMVRHDLRNLEALATWLPALQPTVVFNMAGYGVDRDERDEREADRINHVFVEQLTRVVATLPRTTWDGARLVHIGSALEYGSAGGIFEESSPCVPTTTYGRTKLAGTLALQRVAAEFGTRACVARLFTVYGPGEHAGRLLPSLIAARNNTAPVRLSAGTQRRDFAYVEDVVEGLLRLATSEVGAGAIVNVGSGVLHSVRHFAECAAEVLGLPGDQLEFGALETRPDEMAHDGVSVRLLDALTAWHPGDAISRGVARTMERLAESSGAGHRFP